MAFSGVHTAWTTQLACVQGRAMQRLAEDRKGPSSMVHKKRQMLAALDTNVKV